MRQRRERNFSLSSQFPSPNSNLKCPLSKKVWYPGYGCEKNSTTTTLKWGQRWVALIWNGLLCKGSLREQYLCSALVSRCLFHFCKQLWPFPCSPQTFKQAQFHFILTKAKNLPCGLDRLWKDLLTIHFMHYKNHQPNFLILSFLLVQSFS